MPNDLSVSPAVLSTSFPAENLTRAETSSETAGQATSGAAVASKVAAGSSTALFANPSLQLNADLGIVVIEFRDSAGSVTNQIPSQRQLDAYIAGSAQVPGGTPSPVPAPVTPSPATPAASSQSGSGQAESLQSGTHVAAIQEAAAVAATAPAAAATSAPSKAISNNV